jgi:hypothetical protein
MSAPRFIPTKPVPVARLVQALAPDEVRAVDRLRLLAPPWQSRVHGVGEGDGSDGVHHVPDPVDVRLVRGRCGEQFDRDGLPLGEHTADGLQQDGRLLVRTAHEQRIVLHERDGFPAGVEDGYVRSDRYVRDGRGGSRRDDGTTHPAEQLWTPGEDDPPNGRTPWREMRRRHQQAIGPHTGCGREVVSNSVFTHRG